MTIRCWKVHGRRQYFSIFLVFAVSFGSLLSLWCLSVVIDFIVNNIIDFLNFFCRCIYSSVVLGTTFLAECCQIGYLACFILEINSLAMSYLHEEHSFFCLWLFCCLFEMTKGHFEVAFSAPELKETIRRSKQFIWKYVLRYVHFHSNKIHWRIFLWNVLFWSSRKASRKWAIVTTLLKKFFNMKH